MQPWKGGVLTLDPVVERLRQLLPATFEELPVPLAVGVVDQSGKHILIRSGPLPEAVAASAAIPMIFSAVDIPGGFQLTLNRVGMQGLCYTALCLMHSLSPLRVHSDQLFMLLPVHCAQREVLLQVLQLDPTLMAVRLTVLR